MWAPVMATDAPVMATDGVGLSPPWILSLPSTEVVDSLNSWIQWIYIEYIYILYVELNCILGTHRYPTLHHGNTTNWLDTSDVIPEWLWDLLKALYYSEILIFWDADIKIMFKIVYKKFRSRKLYTLHLRFSMDFPIHNHQVIFCHR